jgi:hypothetical protein
MRTIRHSRSFREVSIILSIAFTLLVGCSDALKYEVATMTDEQRARVQQILTAAQAKSLDEWIARKSAGSVRLPPGVTVQQALSDQEDWLAKRKIEEAKADEIKNNAQAERAAQRAVLAKVLDVAVVAKKNKVEMDYRKVVVLEIRYDNKSDKDIRGLKGVFKLTDIYGAALMDVSWSYDGAIAAGKTVIQHDAVVPIDKLVEAQEALWETDFEHLRSTFEINSVLFKDGTSMNAHD